MIFWTILFTSYITGCLVNLCWLFGWWNKDSTIGKLTVGDFLGVFLLSVVASCFWPIITVWALVDIKKIA